MNIFILTFGTHGDVQPYVALGKGLQAAGHRVTLCASSNFAPFVTAHGLEYGYMNDDFIKLIDSASGRDAIESGGSIFGMAKAAVKLLKKAKALIRGLLDDSWKAAQAAEPELVIFHPKVPGSHIAEKLGVPAIMAIPIPLLVPTAEAVAMGMPDLRLGRWYNRLSFKLVHKGYHMYDDALNDFRTKALGIGKLPKKTTPLEMSDGTPIPVLHAYSESVSPRPGDWPATAYITGYWFLESANDWQPPTALQEFLAAGEPPVYIGFGSMAGRKPQRLAAIVIEALQQAGRRGILATGWGGLDASRLPETVLQIEQAPHDWLFPRVAAVVHHGGAGTTAAGLRAGRPTIICPFIVDQPYWGERVLALGVGSQPIPQKKLTAQNLAAAIHQVTGSQEIRQRAASLGEKLREEDGIAKAIAIIEQLAQARQKG